MAKKLFKKVKGSAYTPSTATGSGSGSGNPEDGVPQSSGAPSGGSGSGTAEGESEGKGEGKSDSKYATEKEQLKEGSKFYGKIKTAVADSAEPDKKPKVKELEDFWEVTEYKSDENITVKNRKGEEYKTSLKGITMGDIQKEIEKRKEQARKKQEEAEKKAESEKRAKNADKVFESMSAEDKLETLIDCGINNLWMVGPAGCGKSTMARNVAENKDLPYLCISCGVGTSAAEFIGYKYPNREATKFAEFYEKPSIILIDEMTALEPAVAQVLNAALANGEIETTTGLKHRHPECIIIATSNTFGNGADRQYVANNQLDSSTLDRFVGGIIEVDYSEEYESQFDPAVVAYVNDLRSVIKTNELRRVASTRMVIQGHKLFDRGVADWASMLITNWSDTEKEMLKEYLFRKKNKQELQKVTFKTAA